MTSIKTSIKKQIKKPIRILSIDGGGVRGLIPIYYLKYLENDLKEIFGLSIFDLFDFYAGTSVGSIIIGSIVYTDIKSISELIDIYFNDKNFRLIFQKQSCNPIRNFFRPIYNGLYKEELIKSAVSDKKLGLTSKNVLITAYSVTEHTAKFFKSYKDSDKELLVAELVNASSSAPAYFPASVYDKNKIGLDGAVFANNPSDAVYADCLEMYGPDADIRILSIGTGRHLYKTLGPETLNWGLLQWMLKGSLFDIMTSIEQDISDYKTEHFAKALGHKYFRVEESEINIALDDISKMPELIKLAHEWYIETKDKVLKEIFDL